MEICIDNITVLGVYMRQLSLAYYVIEDALDIVESSQHVAYFLPVHLEPHRRAEVRIVAAHSVGHQ